MTSFPANPTQPSPFGSIPLPDPEPVRQAKQDATDALVARTRANTPPGVADQRRAPRMSVAEMNMADWDTIRERFLSTRRDDRPPWVRALDMLDAPRNQILSHLAPGLEAKARAAGDTAAFGTGRVNFSDVLGELGMKPGVVRSIVGLAGDLAFDPLTYVGAPAAALKVAGRAGQTASIGLRGSRAILGGIGREGALGAIKRGGLAAVERGTAGDLVRAAALTAEPGLSNADLAAHVSNTILGKSTLGRVGKAFSKVGGSLEHEGGILGNLTDEFGLAGNLDTQAEAARRFVKEYGVGAGPGLRLGKNATQGLFHVPFTDIGIYVPAFTPKGAAAATVLETAKQAGQKVNPTEAAGPGVRAVSGIVQKYHDVADAVRNGYYAGDADTLKAEYQALDTELERAIAGTDISPRKMDAATPQHLADLLSVKRIIDGAKSAEASATAAAEASTGAGVFADAALTQRKVAYAEKRLAEATRGAIKNYAASSNDMNAVRAVNRAFGIDDDRIGYSILSSIAGAVQNDQGGGIAADILRRADRGMKQTFGQPGGLLRSGIRALNNTLTTGKQQVFRSMEESVRTDILKAMEAAGMDARTIEDYQKAGAVTFAHMAALRNAAAEAKIAAGDTAEKIGFFPTRFGDAGDATWVQLIKDAQKDGYFSKNVGKGLSDSLKEIAARNIRLYDSLGSQEMSDEILSNWLNNYVPNSILPGAKARIAAQLDQNLKSSTGIMHKVYEMGGEAFQKERSTLQYRYQNKQGQWKRFWEKDRWVQDLKPADIEELRIASPGAAKHVEELKRTIDYYDAAAAHSEKFAAQYYPRNTEANELNEMVKDGHFQLLLGGDPIPGGDFADNNIATVTAARMMAHELATARQTFLEAAGQTGISAPANLSGYKTGDSVILRDGTEAKFWRDDKTGQYGVTILGQRYRPLSDAAKVKSNPVIQGIGNAQANIFHEDWARAIEDASAVYEKQADAVLRLLDAGTSAWKSTQLMHPSWSIANFVGNIINYTTGDARLSDMIRNAAPMARIFANQNNPEALRNITLTLRGVPVNGEQFLNDLRHGMLLGNNQSIALPLELINRKFFYTQNMVNRGETGLRGVRQALNPATLKGEFLQRLEHEAAAGRIASGARAAGFVARDRLVRSFIAPWFHANGMMEDYMKALAYSSFVEQGHDIPMAVRKTTFSGMDYGDLTRVERNVFRRMFPFYCVPDHSEILTRSGWKHRADLVIGEDVMTYSIEKDCLEWQPCLDVAVFDHDQDLTVIENKRGVRLECTDEHRWVVRTHEHVVKGKKYGGQRKIVRARDFQTNHSLLMTAEFHGIESLLTPEQARLYGWLLTDGYWRFKKTCNGKKGGTGLEAVIYQSPKKFLKEVTRVAGGKPRKPHPGTGVVCVPVLSDRLAPILGLLRLGKSGCSHVPAMLSRAAAEAMYEAMYQAEGAIGAGSIRKRYKHVAAQNPAIRECVKLLAFMLGKRTTPNQTRGCYVSDRRVLQLNEMSVKKEHYFGKVWCPNTANGTWVMRQNGTLTITGNSWMKGNGALQLHLLLKRPIYAGMYPLLENAAEEALNGEQQVPLHARPSWMRNQLALMIGKNPDDRVAVMLGSGLPVEQALVALSPALGGPEGIQDFLKYFVTGANPFPRSLAEIGVGREFFTDRTIGPQGDMTVPGYIASQFRPYREAGKIGETYQKHGLAQAASRVFLGGRVQAADDARIHAARLSEFKAEEERLRRQISTATYKNDMATSVRARAAQLALYRDMLTAGYEEAVPKWAVAQLAQLQPAQVP